jgi:hypothetical protein
MPRDVTVAIVTWIRYPERLDYLGQTLCGLRDHLQHRGRLARILISAERESVLLSDELDELCASADADLIWHDGVADVGDNMNHLFAAVDTKYVLFDEDDWMLDRDLDITPDLSLLDAKDTDLVRYSWWTTPERAAETPEFTRAGVHYFRPRPDHLPAYPAYYSNDPFVAALDRWYKVIGPYRHAGREHGFSISEEDYDLRCRAAGVRISARVRDQSDWTRAGWGRFFRHIGTRSAMTEKWDIFRRNKPGGADFAAPA